MGICMKKIARASSRAKYRRLNSTVAPRGTRPRVIAIMIAEMDCTSASVAVGSAIRTRYCETTIIATVAKTVNAPAERSPCDRSARSPSMLRTAA